MSDFGKYLKELRKKKGYGVNQLGTYSGVSATLISKIENGYRKNPKPETILKLSIALKTPYEELMQKAGHLVMSNEVTETKEGVHKEETEDQKKKRKLHELADKMTTHEQLDAAIIVMKSLAKK